MAYAATGEFGNMCSWGLANHKDVKTDCSINSEFRGRTYCFSSRESQTNFMKDPSGNLAKAESFYKSAKASQTERLQRLHSQLRPRLGVSCVPAAITSSKSASTAAWPLTSLTLTSVALPCRGRMALIARSRA